MDYIEVAIQHNSEEHAGYVEFRCEAEPNLYVRYDPRHASGFVPRTGELVDIPPVWGSYGRYRVLSVETMLVRYIHEESREDAEKSEEEIAHRALPNTFVVRVTCQLERLSVPSPPPPPRTMMIQ
jgi:hypothetical protein